MPTATEVKNNFGKFLDEAIKGNTIEIFRNGRRISILISEKEYDRLLRLEELFYNKK